MAHHGKRGWLLALGILTLCVAPAAAGPADKPGIDGRIPEPPRCSVLRDVLWPPSNRFVDIQFHAQTEPDHRIFTFIYSNTFPSRRGDALTGWNASLSLRAALKRRGPTYPPEARVYLIVVAANSPMGGWAYSTCTVVVPVNPGLTALEEARAKARAAEEWFHETGTVPDGYYPVLESNSLESLPTVTITASDPTASEAGPDDGVFTVTRTAPSGDMWPPLTVYYQRSGTATHETDYQELSSSVTIDAGSPSADIYIYPSDDGQVEGTETVTFQLIAYAGDPYVVGEPSSATVNIEDNDVPATVTISASNTPETIGNSGGFVITRDGDLTWPLKVYHSGFSGTATPGVASEGGDYTTDFFGSWGPGYYEIPAGGASITIYILPQDDTLIEGPETVILTLSDNSQYELGTPSATVTIEDDDYPTVRFSSSTYQVAENGSEATVTVTLSTASPFTTTVDYGTTGGSAIPGLDYTTVSGTFTFAPGETSKTFTVPILNDTVKEVDETVTLILVDPTNAVLEDPPTAELTITDDGDATPSVQFTSGLYYALEEPDGSVTITVTLSAPADQTVTVSYTTSDDTALAGSDYTATGGTLTFIPGETSLSFSVPLLDDSLSESNEIVKLTLSNPDGATLADPSSAEILIIDDDPVSTLQFEFNEYVADESIGSNPDENLRSKTITVTLSAPAGTPITVDYYTTDNTALAGSDYTEASGTLTFAPGEISKSFSIDILDNAIKEPEEKLLLALENPRNATLGEPAVVELKILDNDTVPSVQFDYPDFYVWEDVEGGKAKITVTLSATMEQSVHVYYSTSDGAATTAGGDYTGITNGLLIIPPDTTSTTFDIQVNNDGVNEPNEYLTITLLANPGPINAVLAQPVAATLTILDKSAFVITDLYNTGVKDDATPKKGPTGTGLLGDGLEDTHYTVTGPGGTSYAAKTSGNLHQAWVPEPNPDPNSTDPKNSRWLLPGDVPAALWPPGEFTWKVRFTLPANVDRSRLVITGRWAVDDRASIYLNKQHTGNTIAAPYPGAYGRWHPFTIAGAFQEGENELRFVVKNDQGWTGLRVEFTGAVVANEIEGILDEANNPIVQKVTTIVGRRVKLKGKPPENVPVTSERWVIPGEAVWNYTQAKAKGEVRPLVDLYTQSREALFYWIDGGVNREVQYIVTSGSTVYMAKATFDVKRPTADFVKIETTKHEPAVNVPPRPPYSLQFGTVSSVGIEWTAEVDPPVKGQIAFVQLTDTQVVVSVLIGSNLRTGTQGSKGKFILDARKEATIPQYVGVIKNITTKDTLKLGDWPASELGTGIKVTRTDKMKLYLMYKPDGDSIWVTLRELGWEWGGAATSAGDGHWTRAAGYYTGDKHVQHSDSFQLPQWETFTGALEWEYSQ